MSDFAHTLPCIMLVDDDPDQLLLTRNMLEKLALKNPLVEVGGGQEAIDYLAGCCGTDGSAGMSIPLLVVLDLRMPTVDGFDVLTWVRSKPALDGLKVIILSSSDEPDAVKRSRALGANGFFVKHPHPAVIACVLREVLGDSATPFSESTRSRAANECQ
jgi:CheY-like chemotaxis protein